VKNHEKANVMLTLRSMASQESGVRLA
jgi:hypothetical protein